MKSLNSYIKNINEGIFDNIARTSEGDVWLGSARSSGVFECKDIDFTVTKADDGVDEVIISGSNGNIKMIIHPDKSHFPNGRLPKGIRLVFTGAKTNVSIKGPRGFILRDMSGFDFSRVKLILRLDISGCHIGSLDGIVPRRPNKSIDSLLIGRIDDISSMNNINIFKIWAMSDCNVHEFIINGLAKFNRNPSKLYLDGVCKDRGYTPEMFIRDLYTWIKKGRFDCISGSMLYLSLRDNNIDNIYFGDSWPVIYEIDLRDNPLNPHSLGFRLPSSDKCSKLYVDPKVMREIEYMGKMKSNIFTY